MSKPASRMPSSENLRTPVNRFSLPTPYLVSQNRNRTALISRESTLRSPDSQTVQMYQARTLRPGNIIRSPGNSIERQGRAGLRSQRIPRTDSDSQNPSDPEEVSGGTSNQCQTSQCWAPDLWARPAHGSFRSVPKITFASGQEILSTQTKFGPRVVTHVYCQMSRCQIPFRFPTPAPKPCTTPTSF